MDGGRGRAWDDSGTDSTSAPSGRCRALPHPGRVAGRHSPHRACPGGATTAPQSHSCIRHRADGPAGGTVPRGTRQRPRMRAAWDASVSTNTDEGTEAMGCLGARPRRDWPPGGPPARKLAPAGRWRQTALDADPGDVSQDSWARWPPAPAGSPRARMREGAGATFPAHLPSLLSGPGDRVRGQQSKSGLGPAEIGRAHV